MTDPRMTPTNDAPVTVEQIAARLIDQTDEPWPQGTDADRLHYWRDKAIDCSNRLAALASAPAGKLDRDYTARRIKELMDEGDGFWRACSGCQEGEDGYVSEKDYPFDPLFRCQPGGGCSECGGIGVLWDDGRGYGDITGDEELASAPAGDGVEEADAEVSRIMAMSDDEIVRTATVDDAAWARGFKLGLAASGAGAVAEVIELARRDIAREQTDFLGRMSQALCTYHGIFDDYPDGDLPDDAREADDQISALAGLALAQLILLRHPSDGTDPALALDRPRAAVGEREAWELPDLRDLHRDIERVRNHDLGNDRMRDLLRGAMDMLKAADVEYAALQSPPAKVEGE